MLHFYTGLQPKLFELLLTWLKPVLPSASDPRIPPVHYLTDAEKLLLVLMRIRGDLLQEDLAFRFGIDQSSVS